MCILDSEISDSKCLACDKDKCRPNDCSFNLKFVCTYETYPVLAMRGLCPATVLDKVYIPYFTKENLYLIGESGSIIYRNSKDFITDIYEITGTKASAITTKRYEIPNGNMEFQVKNDRKCSDEDQIVMVNINACNASEFNCGDGSCIDLSLRCDAISDCTDGTDELTCTTVALSKIYNKDIISGSVIDRSAKLEGRVSARILNFLDIDEPGGIMRVQFVFKVTWRDPRLNFFNLKQSKDAKSLNSSEAKSIWTPKLLFVNSEVWRHEVNTGPSFSARAGGQIRKIMKAGMEYTQNAHILDGRSTDLTMFMDIRYTFPNIDLIVVKSTEVNYCQQL